MDTGCIIDVAGNLNSVYGWPLKNQVWTVWYGLYVDFFINSKYCSITESLVGWILRCHNVDTEEVGMRIQGDCILYLEIPTVQRVGAP